MTPRMPALSFSSKFAIFIFILVSTFTYFAYDSVAQASCSNMWDEWLMWDRPECRATMILQPYSRGNLHSRSRLDANLGYLQGRGWGGNRNFVWYSNEAGLRAGIYPTGQNWSYWSNGTKWIYIPSAFQYYTWLSVFEYNGTFISRVCGNFTKPTVNPPNPIISGSKWNDLNENGVWDAGEPKIAGWPITLAGHENSATNSYGDYAFNMDANWGRLPGCYTVTEGSRAGWRSTTATSRSVCIPEGAGGRGVNFGQNNFGNFKYGTISGTKWIDKNGNGVIDPAVDSRGAKWTMVLKKSGTTVTTAETDANGNYSFPNLHYGNYTIEEQLPNSSWQRILPASGEHSCSVISGTVCTGKDFLNAQYGSIQPLKVHDLNMNAVWDQQLGETLLAGWKMYIGDSQGTLLPFPTPNPLVSADSKLTSLKWERLAAGTYTVWEDPESQPNYIPTDLTRKTVPLGAGQDLEVYFYNVAAGIIDVIKFNDSNGDGVKGDDEVGIEGWSITLTGKDEAGADISRSCLTDASGMCNFDDLAPGDYVVQEEVRTCWLQTTGTSEDVHLSPGMRIGIAFGNRQLGDIEGYKYEDLNGNGLLDPGEPPAAGVEICLTNEAGEPVGLCAVTGEDGRYEFKKVPLGHYNVTEIIPDDSWYSSTGITTTPIEVISCQTSAVPPFLNTRFASITGTKVDDQDAGADRDPMEPGLPGWEIVLEKMVNGGWSVVAAQYTAEAGVYEFTQLKPGDYRVSERMDPVSQSTWNQTFPAQPHQTSLKSGDRIAGNDFGNVNTGSIKVIKWDDRNQNAGMDQYEDVVAGWQFRLKGTAINGTPVDNIVTTGPDGTATIGGLLPSGPDGYVAEEESRPYWLPPAAGARKVIHLLEGSIVDVPFGNTLVGDLEGYKQNDKDGDGVLDPGEPPVPGVKVCLAAVGSQYARECTSTDSNGRYEFKDIPWGDYVVSETVPDGWKSSALESIPVSIEGGRMNTAEPFLNVELITLTGVKFDDGNANGARDQYEPELAGWQVNLETNNDGMWTAVGSQYTAADGSYQFVGLWPGMYRVSEAADSLPGDWEQTSPATPGTHELSVLGGDKINSLDFGNVKLGSITAGKWHDLNFNHVNDDASPISGWNMSLTGTAINGESIERTGVTDQNGVVNFDSLLPGEYILTEESRDWWAPTTETTRNNRLNEGQMLTEQFGNILLGEIEGYKYEDLNGNGHLDIGEPPVSGVLVRLTPGDEETANKGRPDLATYTDDTGKYEFTGVVPGTYLATEDQYSGWAASTGITRTISVEGGRMSTADPFLNVELVTLSGVKFDDSNANSARDQLEPGLAGWQVNLETNKDGQWTAVDSQYTAADGSYSFSGLWPGTYRVNEIMQDGWQQTLSPESVSTISGDVVGGMDFGNVKLGSITVAKWDDSNGDGAWDSSEKPLSDWGFHLTGNAVNGETVDNTCRTGTDGTCTFGGLLPGDYSAEEEQIGLETNPDGSVIEPGWKATTPIILSIVLREGAEETRTFGNIHLGWIQGRVTHEVWGNGIPNIKIVIEEIAGLETRTNSDGYYYFYGIEPNKTALAPTLDYLVGMDLSGTSWLTHGPVDQSVVVPEGGHDVADFTVYNVSEATGNQPRTIGYWKNWDNHYSRLEMEALVALVRSGSTEFSSLTVDQVYSILQVDRKTTMENKARAQFLANWLNIASAKLGLDTIVNVSSIFGWQIVITSADQNGITNVLLLTHDIEALFASTEIQSSETWEIAKNVLDALNNLLLT